MNSPVDNNDIIGKFVEFLKIKKLRKTPERFALLEYIASSRGHFTIDMLQKNVEEKGFRVSLATVYNTVNLLVKAQMLHRHDISGAPVQFELASSHPHFHLVCTTCGKLKEVHDNHFIAFMNTRKYAAFTPEYYSLYAYGTCSTCARKKNAMTSSPKKKNKKQL